MARQRFEKGSEMFEFFMDYWKLVQDFYIVESNDNYWQQYVDASSKLADKYNTEFVRSLIHALTCELERRNKDATKDN